MALMLYLITVTKTSAPQIWDPYDILGISMSSNEGQIKKRYRDLSRTLHPDKAIPDESRNETLESINDHWVEVSKAFKALTDEEIRNNYIQYGHPDGKQGFSIGIALPKFIITEGNGKYVLLVYGLLLGVLLPYSAGKWWYGTQRITKEKVLLSSASNLFREYSDTMTDGDVVNALSSGREFDDILRGSRADDGLGKIEQNISQPGEENITSAGLQPADHEKLSHFEGVRRKAAALLWAYLGRRQLDGGDLDDGSKPCRLTAILF
ncbi:MAG: secretory subunit [Ramalina farinacea]|uniref:Secretory subunit n=1 Tax=Ramalina farinacea TaxID=258253 RepID=A0AA43QJT9_9LECA|nr:secretory subunit [Ramalina farinacea]